MISILTSCARSQILRTSETPSDSAGTLEIIQYCEANIDEVYHNKNVEIHQNKYTEMRNLIFDEYDFYDLKIKNYQSHDLSKITIKYGEPTFFELFFTPKITDSYSYIKYGGNYSAVSVKRFIIACDEYFLKDRDKKMELKRKKLNEEMELKKQTEIEESKQTEKDRKDAIRDITTLNDRVKKLGFRKGFFGYDRIIKDLNDCPENQTFCLTEDSIGSYASVRKVNEAILNNMIKPNEVKNYIIIKDIDKFYFINYDNKYAYYRLSDGDMDIAVKKQPNQVYMQNSQLDAAFFRFIGVIRVSKLILRGSNTDILAFEEVKLTSKQLDSLSSLLD